MKEDNNEDFFKIIGKNIKQIRLLRGLSQEKVAYALDKSVNFISLIENGKAGLSTQTLIDMCKLFNVDTNTIFAGVINEAVTDTDDFIKKSLDLFNEQDKSIIINLINYINTSKK